jgi:hypothetical protein
MLIKKEEKEMPVNKNGSYVAYGCLVLLTAQFVFILIMLSNSKRCNHSSSCHSFHVETSAAAENTRRRRSVRIDHRHSNNGKTLGQVWQNSNLYTVKAIKRLKE